MRYWKGSINLSPTRDYPLLRQVLRCSFVSHKQLHEFMQLEYCTSSRQEFNNRTLRLVNHGYLVRQGMPYRTEGHVYSVSDKAALELVGLGEYYTSNPVAGKGNRDYSSVLHALELNEVHLALKKSNTLVRWVPETEIRSRNELTSDGYVKDYDAVVSVRCGGAEKRFALEYERSAKTPSRYTDIACEIEHEDQLDRFLYLVSNYDLLSFVSQCFLQSNRAIYFGLASDFNRHLLNMQVRRAQRGSMQTLSTALAGGRT